MLDRVFPVRIGCLQLLSDYMGILVGFKAKNGHRIPFEVLWLFCDKLILFAEARWSLLAKAFVSVSRLVNWNQTPTARDRKKAETCFKGRIKISEPLVVSRKIEQIKHNLGGARPT